MKVVTVLTSEAKGGAEFAAVAMLDALAARGHDTVILANAAIADGLAVGARSLDLGPKMSSRTWVSLLLRTPQLARRLHRELDAVAPYDVLIVHFKKEQLLAATLRKRLRGRLAWVEWGPVPRQLRRGLPRRLYVAAARRANVIMAISEGTRDSVLELGVPPEKVIVVPNALRADEICFDAAGRDRLRRELGMSPDEFVVGCVSRLHPLKRNDVVVDAIAAMGDGVRLVIAGEGETESSLRELARKLGVRVDFIPTPGDNVSAVLSAFDVSVFCPSPTEGAPRAVIIAMLAGRPCVSTGREGVVGLIEPGTGTIVQPDNDAAALAAVLREYRDDPDRVRNEGARARERAEQRFDVPVVGELLERVLSE
jgi:glycosyltransferase involved in cell wall biosynthesis